VPKVGVFFSSSAFDQSIFIPIHI